MAARPGKASGKFWRWVGPVLGVVVLAGLVWGYRAVKPYGEIGTTYIAKQLCSCVFLTGRTDASCHAEFEPDIDRMSVRIDHAKGRVSARLAIFANSASYSPQYGCRIEH